MGSSYQRGLEEGMKSGCSAVQLFQEAVQNAQTERLNDAKYQGSILGWARRNYDGRVQLNLPECTPGGVRKLWSLEPA
jgi:hypothetical protein